MGIRCGKCKSGNVLTSYVPGVGPVGSSCIMCGNYAGSQFGFYHDPPREIKKPVPNEGEKEMAKVIRTTGTCSNCKRPGKKLYAHDLCGGCHQHYYTAPKENREQGLAKAREKFMQKKAEGPTGNLRAEIRVDAAGSPGAEIAAPAGQEFTAFIPAAALRVAGQDKDKRGDKRQFDVHYLESRDGKMIAAIKAKADKQRRGISAQVLCMLEYAIEQKFFEKQL